MFTGIVQGTAKVVSIDDKPNFRTHVVELPAHMLEGLETGASVANNGCCLTVTEINGARISFDLMKETLRITNLGDIQVGDEVNVERAAKFSDEIKFHSSFFGFLKCHWNSQIIWFHSKKTCNNRTVCTMPFPRSGK